MKRVAAALLLYRAALRLLPKHFRQQYAGDLLILVRASLVEQASRGWLKLLGCLG